MLVYYAILLVAGLSACAYSRSRQRISLCFWWLVAFVVLTIPAAIRYGIGTDYLPIYVPKLIKVLSGEYDGSEYGYYLLEKVVLDLTGSGVAFFAVAAALKYTLVLKSFPRRRFFLGVLWYVLMWYTASYNAERQSIAVGFVLMALGLVLQRRNKLAFFLCLIGSMFHYSALLALPFALFAFTTIKMRKVHVWVILSLVVIVSQLSPIHNRLFSFVPMDTRYGDYLTDSVYGQAMSMGSGLGHWGIVLLFVAIGCFLLAGSARRNARALGVLCVLAAAVRMASVQMSIIERFVYISDLAVPFALFELLRLKSIPFGKLLCGGAFGFWFLLFVKGLMPIEGSCLHEVVPYRTIFTEQVGDILDGEEPPK